MKKFVSLKIQLVEFKDNEHLVGESQQVRPCTRQDFSGLEDVFDLKGRPGPNSLICINDPQQVQLQNTISNRISQKHFEVVLSACDSTKRSDCVVDEIILR